MKKQKYNDCVYISGKITDHDKKKQIANLRKFDDKEVELKKIWKNVFNPASLESNDDVSWESYLARDLKFIFEERPDLYMMDGWLDSKGAKLERECAKILGLAIYYEKPFESFKK
jgi:enamine deaminase RidA (YjgF/YER057c/UK114 family)